MNTVEKANPSFLFPPGGILIWIIVLLEVLTFGIALLVFRYQFHLQPDAFIISQNVLSKQIGLFNTIVLISSGYFMASALVQIKQSNQAKALRWLLLTIITGVSFLFVKTWEYSIKISEGFIFGYDDFFDFYWMLTVFHFVHVLVGVFILIVLFIKLRKGQYDASNHEDIETGGIFWHMCDLIWILLFPILYLLQ